jgi:hypothetical protein
MTSPFNVTINLSRLEILFTSALNTPVNLKCQETETFSTIFRNSKLSTSGFTITEIKKN